MQGERRVTYIDAHRLAFELAVLSVAIVIPVSVHAGFFSMFFDTAVADSTEEAVASSDANIQTLPLLRATPHVDPNPAVGGGDILVSDGALIPSGDSSGKPEKTNSKTANGEISVYVVREGDTLSQIAEMYDVSSKTILWANDITDPSKIRPGDSLVILPITGVRHVMKSGDTIKTIAAKYEGDVDDILAYNQLASAEDIHVGETIVIPDGMMSAPTPAKKTGTIVSAKTGTTGKTTNAKGSAYSNPLPGSIKTQGIHGYNAVDFSGVPVGTPVLAALTGEVIVAKSGAWNGGYGSYVVIKHANGTQTLYGHLSKVSVTVGQKVSTGTPIGTMGNTGRSTGPHLHFEIRGARNPF